MQKFQNLQILFSCTIRNELDQWSLQPSNVALFFSVIFDYTFAVWYAKNKRAGSRWEYKVVNIASFVRLWKSRFNLQYADSSFNS